VGAVVRRYLVTVAAEIFVWMLLSAFVEVAVTATVERISLGDRYVLAGAPFWSLQGHTTLWVVVVAVGLTFGLRAIVKLFERGQRSRNFLRHLWVQGVVVMLLIYALELVGGLFFNELLGWHLWDYSQYEWHGVPLHLRGQITLVYAPFWFLAGIFCRPVYRAVHAVAPAVGKSMSEAFDRIGEIARPG
jgi:hypothetical protein